MVLMAEVLERLERALPRAPALKASLREPVSETDLDALRRAVSPRQLPDELVALLRWADGQSADNSFPWAPLWPGLHEGSLLPAEEMARQYQWRRSAELHDDWPALLLPICGEQLSQASIELVTDRPGVLVATPFDGPMCVSAPSVAAMLDATALLLESDHPLDAEHWNGENGYAGWYQRREAILQGHYADQGWEHWAHGRGEISGPEDWPPHWHN